MDAAWFAVLVLYVIQVLHQRSGAYGLLLAIAALGGIATGAFGTRLTRRLGPWPSLLVAGLAMAGTQAGLGLNANVIIAAVLLFTSSAAFALFNMTAVTMRQRLVPAGLLGRVASLYGTVARGAEALGAIGGGALAATARDTRPYARRSRAHRRANGRARLAALPLSTWSKLRSSPVLLIGAWFHELPLSWASIWP